MKSIRSFFAALCSALVLSLAGSSSAGVLQIGGALVGVDARYQPSLPNDFEIVLYGDGLVTADVAGSYANAQWGPAQSTTAAVNNDPNSPAFGLNGLVVRYFGPPLPAQVGQMLSFGARQRIGAAVVHQEFWWTINGIRILRPEAAQAIWHATKNGWLIEIANPNPTPIYVYGARFFAPATTAPLPLLSQLNANINPTAFGATGWTNLTLPGSVQVFAMPAYAQIFLKVPSLPLRPVVLQIAARNVPVATLPLPPGTTGPNPNDFDGENGTMTIVTTRPAEEFAEDLTGDGVVGTPDFNQLRSRFGTTSADQ